MKDGFCSKDLSVPLRILQLTDLHVFSSPHVCLKGIPTRETLQEVVEFIRVIEADFDHVVITGDHTHDEHPDSYAAVRHIVGHWIDRLWQVPGNHDDRPLLRATFANRISGKDSDLITFSFEDSDWAFIGLDTHVPGEVAGHISASQIEWLRTQLQTSRCKNAVLFCHHPPVEVGSEWMDAIGLDGREHLQQVIAEDQRIRMVCCGHVHHEFRFHVGNAEIVTTPSTGIQFSPEGSVPAFCPDAPGFRIIEIDGDTISTRAVRLPEVRYQPTAD